jgi:hypothetical protein
VAGRGSIGAAWRSRAWRLALALAAVAATLPSPAAAAEQYDGGWALFLDNDALTFGTHDHDYTGGLALTLAGRRAQDWPVSLDGALGWINHGLGVERAHRPPASQWHALQVSLLTFTPAALEQPSPIAGDRPYASIVYLANSRTTVVDADSAYQSSFAVGVLGLDLGKAVQRTLHSAIAADEPRGWDHQISDGGEPTARYTLARLGLQSAFQADGGSRLELKDSVAVSAGYITEVNAAMTLRWGAIHTPWWSFVPERAEYMTEPAPVLGGRAAPGAAREFYAWAGVKARARLYNAFLQGQFRDSDLTYDFDDTRPLMGELWAGVTKEFADGYRLSWVLRYQSSELRTEPGDRDLYWGGVSVSRSL